MRAAQKEQRLPLSDTRLIPRRLDGTKRQHLLSIDEDLEDINAHALLREGNVARGGVGGRAHALIATPDGLVGDLTGLGVLHSDKHL